MLLEVANLVIDIARPRGVERVVNGATFSLDDGESLGVVGESGSGKTMTALALMGLTPESAARLRLDPLRGTRTRRARRGRHARPARGPDRDDLPGADDGAQPAAPRRARRSPSR